MDPSTTPSIPNFEILSRIGGGAYGEVYLGRSVTGMYRAVKVVRREDFEYSKTFEREFQGIQHYEKVSQDHTGLVDVLHVGRDEEAGFYYYVMELADDESRGGHPRGGHPRGGHPRGGHPRGGHPGSVQSGSQEEIDPESYQARTLSSVLKEGTPRSIEQCVDWGMLLAGALGHLHLAGLTHRDVKPANIIFVKGVPKLADVGLVAQSGQRTYVGTEGYVPPEGPGTSSADLYSLAMVLYELHTGKDRLDFPELPTNMEIPPTVNRDEWRALNTVICRAGSPDLRKRYDSAHDFALALREVIPSKLPKDAQNGFSRSPAGSSRKVVVLLLLLLFFGGFIFGGIWLWNDYQDFLDENGPQIAGTGTSTETEDPDLPVLPPVEIPEDPGEDPDPADPGSEDPIEIPPTGKEDPPDEAPPSENPDGTGNEDPDNLEIIVPTLVSGEVKITTRPSGASVWLEGDEIGRTETPPLEIPVGPIELILRHPDFRDTIYRGEIREGFQQIEVDLLPDLGPDPNTPWIDALGLEYVPRSEDSHLTARPISSQIFDLFMEQTGAQIPMNGFQGLAGVRDPKARWAFADWVTRQDRDRGFLGIDEYLRPVQLEGGIDDTFHLEISSIFGTVLVNSSPEGARVHINGELRGATPLVADRVRLGPYEIEIGAPGYSAEVVTGVITGIEPIAHTVELEQDASVIFGVPWRNSLGMDLIPAGDLLVASQETSVRHYRQFVGESGALVTPGAGSGQGLDHPAAAMTLLEARMFCDWLTAKEQELGLLRLGQRYRLPTDREWSLFAGVAEETGDTPSERSAMAGESFPWGDEWPPPTGTGNFADESASPSLGSYIIENYEDGYPETSPTGVFEPIRGLYDLSGNVWEWIDEPFDESGELYVVRGGGWNAYDPRVLRTGYRNPVRPDTRENHYGFRYVLEDSPEQD